MLNKKIFLISLFTICSLCFSFHASADDTIVGGYGENVMPLRSASIEMTYEDLRIYLNDGRKISVEAEFLFKNPGNEENVLVGFPVNSNVIDFKTYVNGKLVKVDKKPGIKNTNESIDRYPTYFVWPVIFKKNGTTIIRNTYSYKPTLQAIPYEDTIADYILKTGATWKGPIRQLDISIYLGEISPDFVVFRGITPAGFVSNESSIEWHLLDYEPSENIRISWAGAFFNEYRQTLLAEQSNNPEDKAAGLFYRAQIYREVLGRPGKANEFLNILMDKYPDSDFSGAIYLLRNDLDKAIESFKKLAKSDDLVKKTYALKSLSRISLQKKDYIGAIKYKENLVKIYDDMGDIIPSNKDPYKWFKPWLSCVNWDVAYYYSTANIAREALDEISEIYSINLNEPEKALEIKELIKNKFKK